MAKKHGARQQKKLAKHKAKRVQKRSILNRSSSKDPTLRFQGVEKWPVLESLVSTEIWNEGLGYVAIARQEPGGKLVYGVYLVDVLCLGVKNAFWREGAQEFKEAIERMNENQRMRPIPPAGLVKIVQGAVDFARHFGFSPHPDYRHTARLLEGIDPADYPHEVTFGRDGRPFYIQGPHESPAEAMAISRRVQEAGGNYIAMMPTDPDDDDLEFREDELDELEQVDFPDERF